MNARLRAEQEQVVLQMLEVHTATMEFVNSLRSTCSEYNRMADTLKDVFTQRDVKVQGKSE